ncbi:sigma-70 family RNA polymerase sigma factor [Novosphingobium flavum]|uniref:Sigma-70 family RNA polymerase sigma factor n=1 Tax=Novosphingobium flavum TaxID=1778672 RepID=A0A7X1KLN9_9SPHN|nr:sigma-70 family RNA polymerase sigma factor [Novosphingobium flavum]MBC2665503.1 sigma-70 family RNA polymerase sigma factor [Novosphingobium flavum]
MTSRQTPKKRDEGEGIESFAPALRRYFSKRAPAADVEDFVQEVFVRMQSRRSEIGIENLQGYLFTVAANVLKGARSSPHILPSNGEDSGEYSDGLTPERIVIARFDAARLVEAIENLSPRTREIFVAHRFEDMTYGAIASLYGISVSAVEKHIMAALRSLSATIGRGE